MLPKLETQNTKMNTIGIGAGNSCNFNGFKQELVEETMGLAWCTNLK